MPDVVICVLHTVSRIARSAAESYISPDAVGSNISTK